MLNYAQTAYYVASDRDIRNVLPDIFRTNFMAAFMHDIKAILDVRPSLQKQRLPKPKTQQGDEVDLVDTTSHNHNHSHNHSQIAASLNSGMHDLEPGAFGSRTAPTSISCDCELFSQTPTPIIFLALLQARRAEEKRRAEKKQLVRGGRYKKGSPAPSATQSSPSQEGRRLPKSYDIGLNYGVDPQKLFAEVKAGPSPSVFPAGIQDIRMSSPDGANGELIQCVKEVDPLSCPLVAACTRASVVHRPIINNEAQATSEHGVITFYDPTHPDAIPIPPGSHIALYCETADRERPFQCTYINPEHPYVCRKNYTKLEQLDRHFYDQHFKAEYDAVKAKKLCIEMAVALKVVLGKNKRSPPKCCVPRCEWMSDFSDTSWPRHVAQHMNVEWIDPKPRKRNMALAKRLQAIGPD